MTPRRGGAVLLVLAGVVLLAASLRIAVASLSPVLDQVTADVPLEPAVIGLIGAAPPLAFVVLGLLTPILARRLRLEALAVLALAVTAVGILGRAVAGDAVVLLAMTLLSFAGVGVGNVIAPAVIKKYFPGRIRSLTATYTAAMSIATIVPAVTAVPIADAAGWRISLGIWMAVAVVAIVPWALLLGAERRAPGAAEVERADASVQRRLAGVPLVWALVAGLGVSAATVYSMFTWLPSILRADAGADAAAAGAMLGVFGGMGLPFALLVPLLLGRPSAVRGLFLGAVLPGLAGVAGLVWAPASAPWLWVILVSLPTALFPAMLALVGLRSRTHETTVALSGFVQSAGYGIAAVFPILLGGVHDVTGGWDVPLLLLAAVFAAGVPVAFVVARPGTVEDAWERRTGRTW